MNSIKTLAVAALFAAGATAAHASVTAASSSGWIFSDGVNTYDNSGGGFGNGINNHYAGIFEGYYHNFFDFTVPNAPVTSATLSIFNSGLDHTADPAATYTVHAPSAYSFDGLVDGVSFGSVTTGVADTGIDHYVNITLDSDGLAYLNANLGTTLHFGGGTTSTVDVSTCDDCVGIFGYTPGYPVAQLYINESPFSPTPEPATWALMIAGFGLVGTAVRRRAEGLAV